MLLLVLACLVAALVAAITAYVACAYANQGLALESGDVFFYTYGGCCVGALLGTSAGQLLLFHSQSFILMLWVSAIGACVGGIVGLLRVTKRQG